MASRPTWQGHLKLSLVSCPVALYTALDAAGDVHFHLLNPETNNRIRMVATDPETGPVERSDLVKGFEVAKDEYVLVTDEDLDAVKLVSTKTIDIERFVPAADIDRIYWDHPYFMVPDGKIAQEAFGVIREAMTRAGQIGIGRVVLSTRERMLALEPRERGILAYSLRTKDEVRSSKDIFGEIGASQPDDSMIEIAQKIIAQKEGPFDPETFTDRYEDALKAMIEAKRKGHKPVPAAEPEQSNVVDLMEALRASLGEKGGAKAKAMAGKPGKPAKAAAKAPAPKRRKAS